MNRFIRQTHAVRDADVLQNRNAVIRVYGHREKSLCTHRKDFRLTCNMLLHYLVKVKNPEMLLTMTAPQQSVDICEHFED